MNNTMGLSNKNRIFGAVQEGRPAIGMYIDIPSVEIVEIVGYAGFDFVRIDLHHSSPNKETIGNMIRAAEAAGLTSIVRVCNDEQEILRVLDMGAQGIIVPDVNSPEDARKAVEAAHFYPLGRRGCSRNTRAAKYGQLSLAEYLDIAHKETLVGIQIESVQALDCLDEILSVPGINLVQSGKADLAQSLGVLGQGKDEEVRAAERKIIEAAKKHNLIYAETVSAAAISEEVLHKAMANYKVLYFGSVSAFLGKNLKNVLQKTNSQCNK